jgi:signal transduction histidine kinase
MDIQDKTREELITELEELLKEKNNLKTQKEKRAAELFIANKELAFQNREKEKRADELVMANKELAFQNEEKEKRAAELVIANKELAHQNELKEKRAAELIIANKELVFQNREKEKRADELVMANKELAFQNEEKEKRAAELVIANKELAYQNELKEKRAAELIIANKELVFQNREKEKRSYELIMANKELAFQNKEKEKRAAELVIANKELAYQNELKEKRAADLVITNNELQQLLQLNADKNKFFSIITHDLKSPFNSIVGFSNLLIENVKEKDYEKIGKFANIIQQSSNRAMDLLMNLMEWAKSQSGRLDFNPEYFDMVTLINENTLLLNSIAEQKSIIIVSNLPPNIQVNADKSMISTVLRNLISNAIKFTQSKGKITLSVLDKQDELTVSVSDNGVGISKERIDNLFNINENYSTPGTKKEIGTGLGLILCKEFINKNNGKIWVESKEGIGTTIYFSLPLSMDNG